MILACWRTLRQDLTVEDDVDKDEYDKLVKMEKKGWLKEYLNGGLKKKKQFHISDKLLERELRARGFKRKVSRKYKVIWCLP